MTISPVGAPTRRSNRPLTQFACQLLDQFMTDRLEEGQYENCNTLVKCWSVKENRVFSVHLYETELLNLVLNDLDEPVYIKLSIGDRFPYNGAPSRAVIERLNGLLDGLGIHGIIPEGVRIFKDRDQGIFYFGNNATKVAVGRKFARNIVIDSDSSDLRIESTDIGFNA